MSADAVTGQPVAPAGGRVELDDAAATRMFRVALQRAVAPGTASPTADVVWIDGDSELLLRPLQARLVTRDGLVLAGIPVSCEQTGDVEIIVALAVGAPGLLTATESRPRGPQAIVSRWGEPLIAAAWDALMTLAAEAAEAGGNATDATSLPVELRVTQGSLAIITQAVTAPQGETV